MRIRPKPRNRRVVLLPSGLCMVVMDWKLRLSSADEEAL